MKLLLYKSAEGAKMPTRKHTRDAGLDVYALHQIHIPAGEQAVVRTGITMAGVTEDCVILVWPKSGLDARLGLHTGAGVIDSGYRGEILVLLKNTSKHNVMVEAGDAIAQLVTVPVLRPEVAIVHTVDLATLRGNTGGVTDEVDYVRS